MQEGETHSQFETVFQAMDIDDDRKITLTEFSRYLASVSLAKFLA